MADVLTWIDATWRTWTEPAAWMLLHAVWQGALVAAVAAAGLEMLRRARPEARYALACTALALMIILPVLTTLWAPFSMETIGRAGGLGTPEAPLVAPEPPSAPEMPAPAPRSPSAVASSEAALQASSSVRSGSEGAASLATGSVATWTRRAAAAVAPYAPWWVAAWALGVTVLSLRTLGGALYLHRLRIRTEPAPGAVRRRADTLRRHLRLSRTVPVRTSRHVDTPMALGWWKPIVLLPASLATGCPPEQLDALIAHELAHVRRHDVLVGWLQTAAETLLFFHPAVWWLSKQIRNERELCCDVLAVRAGTDRVVYAKALAHVAERVADRREPALAMAAGGGALVQRIRHVLAPATPASNVRGRLTVVAAGLLVALLPMVLAACATSADTASDSTPVEETVSEERRDVFHVAKTDSTGTETMVIVRNDSTYVLQGDSAFVIQPDGERRALTDEEREARRAEIRERRDDLRMHQEKMREHEENLRTHRETMRQHRENLREQRERFRDREENLRKHREQFSRYVDSLRTNEAPLPRIIVRDGSRFIVRGDTIAPDTLGIGMAFPDSALARSNLRLFSDSLLNGNSRFIWPDSIPAPGSLNSEDPFFILPPPSPGADVFVVPKPPQIPGNAFRLLQPDAPEGNGFSFAIPDSTRDYRRWIVNDSIQVFSKNPGVSRFMFPAPTGRETSESLRKQAERMEEQARRLRERAEELESRSNGSDDSDSDDSNE